MTIQLSPCLIFNGNCTEAMEFYKNVFDGELTIKSYAEMPEDVAPHQQEKVMHALLTFNENEITAFDSIYGEEIINGTSSVLSLEYENIEEAERVFRELSYGGKVQPIIKYTFWGTKLTLFTDKFGIQWMITL